MASTSWSSVGIGAAALLGLVWLVQAASAQTRRTQSTQDQTLLSDSMDSMGEKPVTLTESQKEMVALISAKADVALLNPAFMIALAVTESSLNPTVIGDDGTSVGLFQMQLQTVQYWNPDATIGDLLDAARNTDWAMLDMRKYITDFPGHTYGDYAEAWTLGASGRFNRHRRNLQKVQHVQQAALDLGLTLNLNEVPT